MHLGNQEPGPSARRTMRFGNAAKVLAKCMLKYYRISEIQNLRVQKRTWEAEGQVPGCRPSMRLLPMCGQTVRSQHPHLKAVLHISFINILG